MSDSSRKGAKAKEEYTLEIDNIIDSLLKVRSYRPGKTVNLPEKDVLALCLSAREVFLSQPALLELEAPLKICGAFFLFVFKCHHSPFLDSNPEQLMAHLCKPLQNCLALDSHAL